MSAASVWRSVLETLETESLAPALELAKSLKHSPQESNFQLFYDGARHLAFDHDEACRRAAPAALQNVVIHLADDLADGDCDYLPPDQAITAVFTFQQLIADMLSEFDSRVRSQIHTLLAQVGIAQHRELSTVHWNRVLSQQAASGLNGCQFQAYFLMLSAATPVAEDFAKVGYDFGLINHFASDIRTGDQRFYAMPPDDQTQIKAECLSLCRSLAQSPFSFIAPYVKALSTSFK